MSHNDRHFDRLNPLAEHPSPLSSRSSGTLCFAVVILGAIGVIFPAWSAGVSSTSPG